MHPHTYMHIHTYTTYSMYRHTKCTSTYRTDGMLVHKAKRTQVLRAVDMDILLKGRRPISKRKRVSDGAR